MTMRSVVTEACSSGSLRVERVADDAAFRALQPEWEALAQRSPGATIFQTWGWLAAWWEAFGHGAELCVVTAREGAELAGIAPLIRSRHGVLGRKRWVIEFLGAHAADYCDLIVPPDRPDVRLALLCWLRSNARLWGLLELDNIPAESPTIELCRALYGDHPALLDIHPLCKTPKLLLSSPEVAVEALHSRRLREAYKVLQKYGPISWRRLDPDEIEEHLDRFFAQHIKRWGPTPTPSMFNEERQRAFYRALARNLAPDGRLALAVTYLDETPIAYDWGYLYGSSLMLHTRSYDYPHGSPGSAALRNWINYAVNRDLAVVDFGRGEEPYKLSVCNASGENMAVHVYRHAWDRWADDLVLKIIARIERLPEEAPARRLLRRLRDRTWGTLG